MCYLDLVLAHNLGLCNIAPPRDYYIPIHYINTISKHENEEVYSMDQDNAFLLDN